jgi:hypothetical protein
MSLENRLENKAIAAFHRVSPPPLAGNLRGTPIAFKTHDVSTFAAKTSVRLKCRKTELGAGRQPAK